MKQSTQTKNRGSFSIEAAIISLVLTCMGVAFYVSFNTQTNDLTQTILAKFVNTLNTSENPTTTF